MSILRITPQANKTAQHSGLLVAVEPCEITLVGYATAIADDPACLRVRVYVCGVEVARFPQPDSGDVWAASDDDATCTLNTNTVQALASFCHPSRCNPVQSRECTVLVDKATTPKKLVCSFPSTLKNWPQTAGIDVPYDLGGWQDDVAAMQLATSALRSEFEGHDHSDGSVSHNSLTDIGVLSHAGIDSQLLSLGSSLSTAQNDISANEGRINGVESGLSLHTHNGSDSQILSHAALSGIGTRTHAQLESDTTEVANALSLTKDQYNAHRHTGTDGTAKVALASVEGTAALLSRISAAETTITALTNAIAALDAAAVKKQTTLYSVTAPVDGVYRNITDELTGDQLARAIPTLVADLKERGIL